MGQQVCYNLHIFRIGTRVRININKQFYDAVFLNPDAERNTAIAVGAQQHGACQARGGFLGGEKCAVRII